MEQSLVKNYTTHMAKEQIYIYFFYILDQAPFAILNNKFI